MNTRIKHFDNHTLYVTSGVAREEQLYNALKVSIKEREIKLNLEQLNSLAVSGEKDSGEKNLSEDDIKALLQDKGLKYKTIDCDIKVNLIVNKDGEYYGFGYVRVSNPEVYWMILGKNPDGSDRTISFPDPTWKPPSEDNQIGDKSEEMSWFDIVQEEDKYVHPIIYQNLGPLMVIPGYKYDSVQYKHLQDMALAEGKDPSKVPLMGYFEFSRAYVRDVEPGKISNVLCARQVPDWIPMAVFKNIFKPYISSGPSISFAVIEGAEGEYPMVTLIDGKKDGRIVFITFDPSSKDAMFCLLMTRKVRIRHPEHSHLKCTLIFDHAYENGKSTTENKNHLKSNKQFDRKDDKKNHKNGKTFKTNKKSLRDDMDLNRK